MDVSAEITRAFEAVEEDITPLVYEAFFAACPAALEVMGHSDEHMQGRMLEQVVALMLDDAHCAPGGYLDWELDNHLVGYGVRGEMYAPFFTALENVLRTAVGEHWTQATEAAWQARVGSVMRQVEVHPATQ